MIFWHWQVKRKCFENYADILVGSILIFFVGRGNVHSLSSLLFELWCIVRLKHKTLSLDGRQLWSHYLSISINLWLRPNYHFAGVCSSEYWRGCLGTLLWFRIFSTIWFILVLSFPLKFKRLTLYVAMSSIRC